MVRIFSCRLCFYAPQISSKVVNSQNQKLHGFVAGGSGNTKDHARFSGLIELDSAVAFRLLPELALSQTVVLTPRVMVWSVSPQSLQTGKTVSMV